MSKAFDPKLREAAEEFKALCEKYDCVGSVLLVSPTHAEFVYHVTSSWSIMHFESKNKLRIRSKIEDFKSKAEQHTATGASAHAVTSMCEWHEKSLMYWEMVLGTMRKHMTIIHKKWGERPDSVPGDSDA